MSSPGAGWSLVRSAGLAFVRCDALSSVPGVAHGFSTRQGPDGADFDLGPSDTREPLFVERLRELARAVGLDGVDLVGPRQVHGRCVVDARALVPSCASPADGVVAFRDERSRCAPAVRVADCVPLLLAERDGAALAAVHAGWRGTAAGIAGAAVARLAERGIDPARLIAALGPSIGPCCYEVGDEVREAVARASGDGVRTDDGGARLDLGAANRLQLRAAGLPADAIHTAPWCTRCNPELLFSWRRDGSAAGRMLACIGWTAPSP